MGDPCDEDDDGDGVPDLDDLCTDVADPLQSDVDGDGIGDLCDSDRDNDGLGDYAGDNCPGVYNPGQEDGDGDGTGDACEPSAVPSFSWVSIVCGLALLVRVGTRANARRF